MLKFKIAQADFDTLSDDQKQLYKQVGDEFVLEVDGVPDESEIERLRKHNETLLAEKKAKAEQAKQAEAERLKLEEENAKKSGDVEALEKSYQAKLEAKEKEISELKQQRDTDLLERESHRIASELTDNPANQKLLQRFIQDKLSVSDGQVKALDANGQPINQVADLVNEFKTCGDYDALITGTKASGTGGSGQSGSTTKAPSEYTEAERLALAQSNPEQFKQLFPIE
ncbi:hypothetical protein [Psychrobacter sp. I-STPA6b]|uniref:hypothetical protein n=1 Tax=Psychrobacter sp. I-STPA6b TaxID=2585718 RepID=UPI001D0C9556|nr:hypothetical protein [Psychrobacter sp. I-STPA6b]